MAENSGQAADFGKWFSRQLARRELTPAEFARQYHFDTGSISRYLNGTRVPGPRAVDRIADALGVSVDSALIAAGHRPPDVHDDPESPAARLLPIIRRIPWTERDLRMFEEQLRILEKSLKGEYFTDDDDS